MKISFVLLVLILTGCSAQKDGAGSASTKEWNYNIVCMNGVKYYERTYALAPVYGTDKQVQLCKE